VSNVNRTRREFYEMASADDIHVLKERIVNIFKAFAIRPAELGMVEQAVAEMEKFVGTVEESDDQSSSSDGETGDAAEPEGSSAPQSALAPSTEDNSKTTTYVAAYHGALQSATKFEQSGNSTKCSPKNSGRPSGWSESNTWKTMKLAEKPNFTELEVMEALSKTHRASARHASPAVVTEVARSAEPTFISQNVKKTFHMQRPRQESLHVSKKDPTTVRKKVNHEGLVCGSQPERLQQLFAGMGVEDDEEDTLIAKLKQKVSNVNRTRSDFYEMVAPDDIDSVKARLGNLFKTFARHPGAFGKVKDAMAEIEAFARII
jgi:hypothetical protein